MEIKINSMKTRISIYISIFTLIITGTVYAQEITIDEIISTETEVQENSNTSEESVDTSSENLEESEPAQQSQSFEFETNIDDLFISEIEIKNGATSSNITSATSAIVFEGSYEESIDDISTSTATSTVVSTSTPQINIFIRNGVDIIFDGAIDYEDSGTTTVTDMASGSHQISSKTVLAQVLALDVIHSDFEISKIQYYESFGSLYVKCITINTIEYCDNWQYLVNGFSPWTGIDQTSTSANDTIVLYFGTPYQIVFDTSLFVIDTPFTARAEQYDYQTNTWSARTGVTLGVTIPDPNNPWSPLELMTFPVNTNGEAIFTVATSGEYMIGVQDDWYYPLYPITVATSATTTVTSTPPGGSGGGSSSVRFNVEKAISFIKSLQGVNGSYGSNEMYSDWVAIAFGGASEQDSKLKSYLKTKNITNSVTDTERRIMAILAMGENPYNFGGKNYVQAVLDSFDGTQIGEKSLVNDDIFGVLVLHKVGFTQNDNQIKKTIEFILSKQQSNGMWENSADLTAAAIQALNPHASISGVSNALTKAKNALRNSQQSDGGWGNVYTTTWVAQAMYELGETWTKNSKSVQDYFKTAQQSDGGILTVNESDINRIWATSYVIPAVLEKSWNDILNSVSKQNSESNDIQNSSGEISLIATSAQVVSTTTEEIVLEVEQGVESVSTSTVSFETLIDEFEKPEEIIIENSTTSTTTNNNSNTQIAAASQSPWAQKIWKTVTTPVVFLFNFILNLF